ncbi:MAG: response regulator [Actinomycetota bacterium]|nr:response regulator [Actinomycetota bacterium]
MSRILIAEDEERLAAFLETGLRANGYVTALAADGLTALTLARESPFDLLILDLGLPRLDGMGVLDELRRNGDRLPVVVLSAREETEDKVGALERGADDLCRSRPERPLSPFAARTCSPRRPCGLGHARTSTLKPTTESSCR